MIAPVSEARFGIRLRPVEPSDAAFIVKQRRQSRAAPFLGDTSPDHEQQRQWLALQRGRPQDAYWLCERLDGKRLGTIGLYNITSTEAEWGRFVIRPGVKAAPGCLLLALTYAFDDLALPSVFCTTVASNQRAIRFYERAGLVRDHHARGHVRLGGVEVETVVHRLDTKTWPGARQTLTAAAAAKEQALALWTEDGASAPKCSVAPSLSRQNPRA